MPSITCQAFKAARALQTLARIRERLLSSRREEGCGFFGGCRRGRLILKHREGVNFLDIKSILLNSAGG